MTLLLTILAEDLVTIHERRKDDGGGEEGEQKDNDDGADLSPQINAEFWMEEFESFELGFDSDFGFGFGFGFDFDFDFVFDFDL